MKLFLIILTAIVICQGLFIRDLYSKQSGMVEVVKSIVDGQFKVNSEFVIVLNIMTERINRQGDLKEAKPNKIETGYVTPN